jgi:hypothetical protein
LTTQELANDDTRFSNSDATTSPTCFGWQRAYSSGGWRKTSHRIQSFGRRKIPEDRLGLDVIYIQAKKWEGTVGRPEIQKFVGALHGKRARKGVFITTGYFSGEALDYVSRIDPKVVLIDGQQIAELMIDFGIGVTPTVSYEIKRIDADYFDEG